MSPSNRPAGARCNPYRVVAPLHLVRQSKLHLNCTVALSPQTKGETKCNHVAPSQTPLKPLRPTDRNIRQELVRVEIGKGCMLLLTPTEYCNAVARGKRLRRRQQFRARIAKRNQPSRPAPLPLFHANGVAQ